jgi:hypothetical protein
MGTKNNVNPDHYKTAGRERPGQDVVQEIHKQKYTQAQNNNETEAGSKFIPGSGKKEKEFDDKGTGNVNKSADSSSSD